MSRSANCLSQQGNKFRIIINYQTKKSATLSLVFWPFWHWEDGWTIKLQDNIFRVWKILFDV